MSSEEKFRPATGLCHRCEHRARYYETGHGPRCECSGSDVYSCYMYRPVVPCAQQVNEGDGRSAFAPSLFSARSHRINFPEFSRWTALSLPERQFIPYLLLDKDKILKYLVQEYRGATFRISPKQVLRSGTLNNTQYWQTDLLTWPNDFDCKDPRGRKRWKVDDVCVCPEESKDIWYFVCYPPFNGNFGYTFVSFEQARDLRKRKVTDDKTEQTPAAQCTPAQGS